MIVEQYGLIYTRVEEKDLETLRYWRNQSFIRNTMQFKDYITPEMQTLWFNKINNKFNYYFIIHHNKKKIGLINCKDVSENKVAEGGIFIWDISYWGTAIPVFASLTMLEAVFKIFKSGDASIATIACDNKIALDFNLRLGYEITETTSDGNFYKLYLSKEKYFSHCQKLMKAAAIISGNQSQFRLIASVSELQSDEINNYILKYVTF